MSATETVLSRAAEPAAREHQSGLDELLAADGFIARHLGPDAQQIDAMLAVIGAPSIAALIDQTVPATIRDDSELALPAPANETDALAELRAIGARNECRRSFIGAGYHNTITPEPIKRNVLCNPGWYTAYTPYQAEISQGRLEALLNFQQMVIDLTGLPVANASLLDEATAAAEAMSMMRRASKSTAVKFFADMHCHPQVLAVLSTRAYWAGIELVIGDAAVELADAARATQYFGAHLQNPDTMGRMQDWSGVIATLHGAGALASVGVDPLALLLIKSPGAMGADVAIGSAQRFGVPLGFGGPHAAFMGARESLLRAMPGRIIGVSRDSAGRPALRMALQTREQHIRRDKATSNICTAQALLANMAAFYAIWHGPQGLRRIALRANFMARLLVRAVSASIEPISAVFFDTVTFMLGESAPQALARAGAAQINVRYLGEGRISVAFDETTTIEDVRDVAQALTGHHLNISALTATLSAQPESIPPVLRRADPVLTHPVFHRYRSETEFMRYLKRLENKDYSLVHGMIPLGSCTMKLNASAEMAPLTWPEFAHLHPFAPAEQTRGYAQVLSQLERWLAVITGFSRVSFQPNSGAQGEYAGLLAIRNYQAALGQGQRDVCLIPASAHGTNPASAQMIGMRIVVVDCDDHGNVDVDDLQAKINADADRISALMITYPSTHGVFEDRIVEICSLVHGAGGQVYMDGANLNAQAGLARPGAIGADVCHLNLHKTFCIPHGGGGPGMGPIAVAAHLAPYLPRDPRAGALRVDTARPSARDTVAPAQTAQTARDTGAIAAAAAGSALILTISWMYIRMMGAPGIRRATEVAILNANYVAARLGKHFPVLYRGSNGRVAHECILDMRHLKAEYGVSAEDVAKRLMDYGFHAPTLSFPVADTLMVEPTESESKAELDRFCDAMVAIHGELQRIAAGGFDRSDNPLKNAPHTAIELAGDWPHSYSRTEAAFPLQALCESKFWPAVKRVDGPAGDRQLVCTCPPIDAWRESASATSAAPNT